MTSTTYTTWPCVQAAAKQKAELQQSLRLFQGKEPCQEYRNRGTISLRSKEVKSCGANPLLSEAWFCTELNRRYHAGASLEAGEPELHRGADSTGKHTNQDPTNCKGGCDSHLNSPRSIRACSESGAFALLSSAHTFLPSLCKPGLRSIALTRSNIGATASSPSQPQRANLGCLKISPFAVVHKNFLGEKKSVKGKILVQQF